VTVTSTAFALSRVLQLLPWFVLGLQLHRRSFDLLRRPWARVSAVIALAIAAVVAWQIAPGTDERWLDREWDAGRLHVSVPVDLAVTLGITVVTAVLVGAALALVPRRRTRLTRLGAFTMYPFLLHGLVVRVLQHVGVHRALIGSGALGLIAITAGAVVLAVLLTLPPVRLLTRWAVEPGSWRRMRPGRPRPGGSEPAVVPSATAGG
jgi:fucose 4-O-acetylase-like acetyltransferase